MTFLQFLNKKRNLIIIWVAFHLFALIVNVFEIKGTIAERRTISKTDFQMEKNIFTTPGLLKESGETYFWPFIQFGDTFHYVDGYYHYFGVSSLAFYGVFHRYDYLAFFVYNILFLLGIYFYWDRKKRVSGVYSQFQKWNPDKSLWIHSINHFKKINYIKNGLTLPFLVGIYVNRYQIFPTVDTLNRVIREIAFTKTSLRPVLMFCDDINEYVISLHTQEYCKEHSFNSIQNTEDENIKINLLIADNAKRFGLEFNSLCQNLHDRYGRNIESKLFSWSGSTYHWREFNEYEKKCIIEIQ